MAFDLITAEWDAIATQQPTSVEWVNPFTGEAEEWRSHAHANSRMFEAAAKRIAELQAQIDEIKSFLVI